MQSVICMVYAWHEEHELGICRGILRQSSSSGYALNDLTAKQDLQFLLTVIPIGIPVLSNYDFENFKIPHEK